MASHSFSQDVYKRQDHLRRGALLHQSLCQTVGAGGLTACRGAGQHNDLCPGAAHLLGGILHPPGVAVLAQLCQRLRAAGCYVIKIYFNQSFRYPDRDHKTQPLDVYKRQVRDVLKVTRS